jgi:hypothetical protein
MTASLLGLAALTAIAWGQNEHRSNQKDRANTGGKPPIGKGKAIPVDNKSTGNSTSSTSGGKGGGTTTTTTTTGKGTGTTTQGGGTGGVIQSIKTKGTKIKPTLPGQGGVVLKPPPKLPVKPPLKPKQKEVVQSLVVDPKANLNTNEKTALTNLAAGTPLSAQDRQSLTALLAPDRPGVSAEAREAIRQGLQKVLFTRRFLQLQNDTGEPLTVWVQYQTTTEKNGWVWFPKGSPDSENAVAYNLAPGKVTYLFDEGWQLKANRVRLWARARSGANWVEYKSQDLWLVPETDDNGKRYYWADEMETYPFTFAQ